MSTKLTPAQITFVLANLRTHREHITNVYSGKPGCGCGCRGTYANTPLMQTRTLNLMLADVANVKADDDDFGGAISFALETDERYRWLYAEPKFVGEMLNLLESEAPKIIAEIHGIPNVNALLTVTAARTTYSTRDLRDDAKQPRCVHCNEEALLDHDGLCDFCGVTA